jgi:hypothetical protein
LTATLVSPNGDEGSAVLELTGGSELGTVSPLGGEVLYEHGPAATRIVVIMDEPGVVRFQVRTEDVGTLPAVSVIQVADGMNRLRGSIAGYQVRFAREKDPSPMGSGGS